MKTINFTSRWIVIFAFLTSLFTGCGANSPALTVGKGLVTGLQQTAYVAGVTVKAVGGWDDVEPMPYENVQVRTEGEDQQLYGFIPATNQALVKLNKAYAKPESVLPGQQIHIYSDYSLTVPPSQNSQVTVTYQWKLIKDGQILTASEPASKLKPSGGHQTIQPINIPKDAEPGTYIVETKLSSGSVYDVNQAYFVVN